MPPVSEGQRDHWNLVAMAAFLVGVALQTWLWSRAWLYDDQVVLLRLGMDWALDGEWAAYAKSMSGGGVIPGCLLQLLVGAPLALWFDYRAPGLLVGLLQIGAGLVLWHTLSRAAGRRTAALFVIVYWLSPWRLYHSGFIWEPAYLLLPAALHLWASWKQRNEPSILASCVLGAVLLCGIQIHASAVVLILVTGMLLAKRLLRPHWSALAGGCLVGGLPLLPTAAAWLQGTMPQVVRGQPWEMGMLQGYPVLKALGYWLRLSSLDVGRRMKQTVFMEEGASLAAILFAIGIASILLTLAANVRVLGRRSPDLEFMRWYAIFSLIALLAATAVSSVTIQGWHTLVVLHSACLPVAIWIESRRRSGGRIVAALLAAFLLLRLPIVALVGLGHPMYVIPQDSAEQERVAPDNLPRIEKQGIPFGKENRKRKE